MANYFNFFPVTFYSSGANNSTSLDIVTNIISRFAFEESLKENSSAFYPYDIKESDTPESIAYKIYGSSERHWIVLMFNDIIDPQYDWPLTYSQFTKYVDEKYQAPQYANNTTSGAGLAWAQSISNIQAYYKIVKRTSKALTSDNKIITEKIQVDANTYANVSATTIEYTLQNGTKIVETVSKEATTYYEYEMQLNEDKRKIKLLKPEFASDVVKEFKDIISQ